MVRDCCARCAELSADLADARLVLGWDRAREREAALRLHLGVTPFGAAVLCSLYFARGRYVPAGVLADLQQAGSRGGTGGEGGDRVVVVTISKMRRVLGRAAIEPAMGRGYRLTDVGRLLCDEAFEAFEAGLRRSAA